MRTWTVANQKGGVGKTTTVVSLGGLAAQRGSRVLLVDLDPHGSLTSYFGIDPESTDPSVYNLFGGAVEEMAPLLRPTGVERLSLLPASTALATLDRQLGSRQGMGLTLRRALALVADDFDLALLDCPPMLGVLMVNALAASERLVIPCQTEFLALKGLDRMLRTLQMVQRSRTVPLPFHIVPTMYDQRTRASVESLQVLRESHGDHVWESVIPEDTQFRDASKQGVPLTVLRPWERGSRAYRNLLASLEASASEDGVLGELMHE
ncbi:MAG TPA: ParA family protein [Gammaproteobacteria bacterium]|nr:ParA family protein [Gammaproteobacteria bacterium]